MRILIEHVKTEDLPDMAKRLEGVCHRLLPPEIILYEPSFELEGLPREPSGIKCGCCNQKSPVDPFKVLEGFARLEVPGHKEDAKLREMLHKEVLPGELEVLLAGGGESRQKYEGFDSLGQPIEASEAEERFEEKKSPDPKTLPGARGIVRRVRARLKPRQA